MKHRTMLAAATLGLTLSFLAATARADGGITVNLKSGATVRGELVEKIPGQKLVLKLATGEVRTVEWGEIVSTDEATPPAPTAPGPPPEESGRVTVHAESDWDGAELQENTGLAVVSGPGVRAEAYRRLCASPCDAIVSPNAVLRFEGPGMNPSPAFRLPRGAARVGLRVKGGSMWAHSIGVLLTLNAGLGVLVGAGATVASFLLPAKDQDNAATFRTVGLVTLGASLAVGTVGLLLFVNNNTHVTTDEGQKIARSEPGLRLGPAGLSF